MFHNPDKYAWTRESDRVNCKMTVGSFFTYVAPAIWGILVGLGSGGGENAPLWVWKLGCLFLVPLGIWRSRPGWRRWMGCFVFLVFMFWRREYGASHEGIPTAVFLLVWYFTFQYVYYADGQERNKQRKLADWER